MVKIGNYCVEDIEIMIRKISLCAVLSVLVILAGCADGSASLGSRDVADDTGVSLAISFSQDQDDAEVARAYLQLLEQHIARLDLPSAVVFPTDNVLEDVANAVKARQGGLTDENIRDAAGMYAACVVANHIVDNRDPSMEMIEAFSRADGDLLRSSPQDSSDAIRPIIEALELGDFSEIGLYIDANACREIA